ncbi:MAG: hypothetical protein AB7G12_10685 [Thermoanaerobaculia bacterium]
MSRIVRLSRLSGGSRCVVALLLATVGAGCGAPPADKGAGELTTVEVTRAPDAALTTADDQQARRVAPALAGALPDGFPRDIPVFRPSSLVDQTILPAGGGVLVFDSSEPRETVAGSLARRLRAEGWRSAADGVWTKAGRRLTLAVESRPSGSRFRLEY